MSYHSAHRWVSKIWGTCYPFMIWMWSEWECLPRSLPEPAKFPSSLSCSCLASRSRIVLDPSCHRQLGFFMLWPFSLNSNLRSSLFFPMWVAWRWIYHPLMRQPKQDALERSMECCPSVRGMADAGRDVGEARPCLRCWWMEPWGRTRPASTGSARPEMNWHPKSILQSQRGS